ncbi:MAG: HAD-IA family hydrolase [Nanoarchaeota archaeon]|nr:HAD-IA family hydrolase [Nanoarchaeota archaeon]
MIKNLIVDLGGVLVPEARGIINSGVAEFLRTTSHELTSRTGDLSQRVHRGELSLKDYYEISLARLAVTGISPEDVVAKHLELYDKTSLKMDPNILELIERLRTNDYKVAAATNTEKEIYKLSSRKGYFELFDYNFVSIEMGMAKPQYQFFGRMLDELDSKPRETIFIDDSLDNTKRACEMGINGLLYETFTKLQIDLRALEVKID